MKKEAPENSLTLFPPGGDRARSQQSRIPKRALTRTHLCWHPSLGLSVSKTVKKYMSVADEPPCAVLC